MGNNFHYVIYPVNNDNEAFNFIGVLKYKLTANELDNYGLFKEEGFIQGIKDKLQNKISANILDNLNDIKCFPVFISKGYLKPGNDISLIGDAFFAFPPSFAQGASQSIEGGYELFDNITNNKSNFYDKRVAKVKMINNRSKLNQFAFQVSNPVIVFFRNISLRILTKNKKYSGEWFRSTDLWVMSPARSHCAIPLTCTRLAKKLIQEHQNLYYHLMYQKSQKLIANILQT